MTTTLPVSSLQLHAAPALTRETFSLRGPDGKPAVLHLARRPPGESLPRFLRRLNLDQLRAVPPSERASIRALFARSKRRKPFFCNTLCLTHIARRGASTARRRKHLIVTVINGKAVGLCAYGFSVLQEDHTLKLLVHIDWAYVAKAWRGSGVFRHVRRQIAIETRAHIVALQKRLEHETDTWLIVPSVVGQGESYSGLQFARRQARSIGRQRMPIERHFRHSRLASATARYFLF